MEAERDGAGDRNAALLPALRIPTADAVMSRDVV